MHILVNIGSLGEPIFMDAGAIRRKEKKKKLLKVKCCVGQDPPQRSKGRLKSGYRVSAENEYKSTPRSPGRHAVRKRSLNPNPPGWFIYFDGTHWKIVELRASLCLCQCAFRALDVDPVSQALSWSTKMYRLHTSKADCTHCSWNLHKSVLQVTG